MNFSEIKAVTDSVETMQQVINDDEISSSEEDDNLIDLSTGIKKKSEKAKWSVEEVLLICNLFLFCILLFVNKG